MFFWRNQYASTAVADFSVSHKKYVRNFKIETTHIRPSLRCDLGSASKTFVEFNKFMYKSLERYVITI
jgi:hypothetical protein